MKIGFIGLGTMGRGIAANLQKAGHDLVVNDVRAEAASPFIEDGAIWAASPRRSPPRPSSSSPLPTPQDVEAVALGADGLAAAFSQGSAWFDLSTNSVEVVRRCMHCWPSSASSSWTRP